MKRFLLSLVVLLLASLPAFADGDIKWGQPVNGLRLGIESAAASATVDQNLTFTITAQNISQQPITVPTPDTYLLKSNRSDDFRTTPLSPIITKNLMFGLTGAYGNGTSSPIGPTTESLQAHVVTIAPGQSVTWKDVPLGISYYIGERPEFNHKTTIQKSVLQPDSVYHIQFQFENDQTPVANAAVWTGQVDSGAVDLKVNAASTEGIKVEGGFSLPKQTYFLGEPIEATFTVTNKGATAIHFKTGGDYRGSDRHDRFSFHADDATGLSVPDPLATQARGGMGGGLGGRVNVNPGESYTEKVLINEWCAFTKSGKYKITGLRTLNVDLSDGKDPAIYFKDERTLPAIPISSTLEITITDNPTAQADYITGLVSAWQRNDQASNAAYEQINSLAQVRNAALFPELVKLLDQDSKFQGAAVQWIADYKPEQASPVLVEHFAALVPQAQESTLRTLSNWNAIGTEPLMAAALHAEDKELRANAVLFCSNRWYGSCVPILLTMGDDPDPIVRRYLGAALGACGDPRAIPVLLKLLHDPDPDPYIKIWAAEGLGKFKRMEGVPVLIDLLRDPKERDAEGNVMATLDHLTNQDLNSNRDAYLAWWEKTGQAQYGKH